MSGLPKETTLFFADHGSRRYVHRLADFVPSFFCFPEMSSDPSNIHIAPYLFSPFPPTTTLFSFSNPRATLRASFFTCSPTRSFIQPMPHGGFSASSSTTNLLAYAQESYHSNNSFSQPVRPSLYSFSAQIRSSPRKPTAFARREGTASFLSFMVNLDQALPQYSLSPNPESWGTALLIHTPELDDFLHNPDPRRDRKIDKGGHIFTRRGLANLGCLFIISSGMLMLL